MSAAAPRVSVVIPTKNAGPWFERTLKSIAGQQAAEPFEIVVIDSGSSDGTLELCKAFGARVLRIKPGEFGHGRTRNQAIAACHSEYVILTVQDAVPANESWLSSLVAALDGAPQAAGAYSRHLPHEGAGFIARQVSEYWYRHQGKRVEQRIDGVASFGSLSLEAEKMQCTFNNVSSIIPAVGLGTLSSSGLAFAEDLAWGYDVLSAGYSLLYEPDSIVFHSHERSLWYEFRRSYVEGKTVGEIFRKPARLMSFRQVLRLLCLWRRIEARARALQDQSQMDQFRQELCHDKDRQRYHRRFSLETLDHIFGEESPYPKDEQRDLLYLLQQAAERAKGGAGDSELAEEAKPKRFCDRLDERIKDTVGSRLARRADNDDADGNQAMGSAAPRPRQVRLSARDLQFIFDSFWNEIGRDYVRRAVLDQVGNLDGNSALETRALPFMDRAFPLLEERLLSSAGGLAVQALKEGVFTCSAYRDIWRYAGAVVIGYRIGEANRYGLGGRWGRALHWWFSRGI